MQSDMTFLHANLRHFHSLLNLLYSSFSPLSTLLPYLPCQDIDILPKSPNIEVVKVAHFCLMYVHICMCTYACMCLYVFYAYKCSLCIHFVYMHVCISVQMFMHVLWKEIALWESTWLGLGGFSLSFYVCRNYQNSRWLYSYFILILPGQKWNQMPACSSVF